MAAPEPNLSSLVERTAHRLRAVQIDASDLLKSERETHLAEEVERALRSLAPESRADFIEAVAERFPTWDRHEPLVPGNGETVRSSSDQRELDDWSLLLSRLIDLGPALRPEERQVIHDRLAAAGLVPRETRDGSSSLEFTAALRAELDDTAGAAISPERAADLLVLLMRFATALNRVAWPTWREIDPKSRLRGKVDLQQMFTNFAAGDGTVSRTVIEQELKQLRRLLAALLGSIPGAASDFARQHADRFAAETIENLVECEPRRGIASREARCWRKWSELAQDIEPATLARELLDLVRDTADQLMGATSKNGA